MYLLYLYTKLLMVLLIFFTSVDSYYVVNDVYVSQAPLQISYML